MATYKECHRRAIAEPEVFWLEQAKLIDGHKPFGKVLDYSRPPVARWFVGGETNLCHNAVDRHLKDRSHQPAPHCAPESRDRQPRRWRIQTDGGPRSRLRPIAREELVRAGAAGLAGSARAFLYSLHLGHPRQAERRAARYRRLRRGAGGE